MTFVHVDDACCRLPKDGSHSELLLLSGCIWQPFKVVDGSSTPSCSPAEHQSCLPCVHDVTHFSLDGPTFVAISTAEDVLDVLHNEARKRFARVMRTTTVQDVVLHFSEGRARGQEICIERQNCQRKPDNRTRATTRVPRPRRPRLKIAIPTKFLD